MDEQTMEIVKFLLQIVSTFGMGGLMTFFVTRKITKNEKKRDEIREEREKKEEELHDKVNKLCEANIVSLRNQIWTTLNDVEDKGYFTEHDFEQISSAFPLYEWFGGNGTTKFKVKSSIDKYKVKND